MAYNDGDVILGGNTLRTRTDAEQIVDLSTSRPDSPQGYVRGVHARNPAMTPKYHTGYAGPNGQNANKSLNKLARMFITFPTPTLRDAFIESVSSVNADARNYAIAMAGFEKTKRSYGRGYIDFFLGEAQESFQENAQIVNVLSDNYVSYFFGSLPPVFRYSGWLMNSVQDDWSAAFSIIYQYITRGTQMARHRISVTLMYDSTIVSGVMMNMTKVLSAPMELASPFSFEFLVKRYDVIPPRMGPTSAQSYPTRIMADGFANTVTDNPRRTERAIGDPIAATEPSRAAAGAGAAGEVLLPETYDVTRYNHVPDELRIGAGIWKVGGLINRSPAIAHDKLAGLYNAQTEPAE